MLVESYRPVKDAGGAGLHRGGAGIEKIYRLLEPGTISIHDDHETVPPWGINGGLHGGTSSKWLHRAGADKPERIKSKLDNLAVEPGDRVIFITAGSGGWGDPLDRPIAAVRKDVCIDLVSHERAKSDYGVVIGRDNVVDEAATEALRDEMRKTRGEPEPFDFGFIPGVHEAAE